MLDKFKHLHAEAAGRVSSNVGEIFSYDQKCDGLKIAAELCVRATALNITSAIMIGEIWHMPGVETIPRWFRLPEDFDYLPFEEDIAVVLTDKPVTETQEKTCPRTYLVVLISNDGQEIALWKCVDHFSWEGGDPDDATGKSIERLLGLLDTLMTGLTLPVTMVKLMSSVITGLGHIESA